MVISATPLGAELTYLWKDFQEVRPSFGLRVARPKFENLDEVLKDDPLFLQGSLVQQLPDVGPRLDKLPCLLLQLGTRGLAFIKFPRLVSKGLSFAFESLKFVLHGIEGCRPHRLEDADEVVNLCLHCAEPLTDQCGFFTCLLGFFTEMSVGFFNDSLPGLLGRTQPSQAATYRCLKCCRG